MPVDLSTWEAEAIESLQIQDQFGLQSELKPSLNWIARPSCAMVILWDDQETAS